MAITERRRHKRIYVHLKARITVDERTYEGYVENISESGVGYLMSSPENFKDDFLNKKEIELNVQITPDRSMVLECVATWAKKGLTSGKTIGVGMSIIDPPPEYMEWLKTLPSEM